MIIGFGFGIWQSAIKGTSASASLVIDADTIAEDASSGTVVGILSVLGGNGTYTFTITADPDSKFAIANDDELQVDAALDYETATSHSVTVEADNGIDDPIERVFTINVTDVGEGGGAAGEPMGLLLILTKAA